MANKDIVVRLKKTERDGGGFLNWVVYPKTNKKSRPAVIEKFNAAKRYNEGDFVSKDNKLLKAKFNIPARFVPQYLRAADILVPLDISTSHVADGPSGIISTLYTVPRDMEVDVTVTADATSSDAGVTSQELQIRNATSGLVAGTINYAGLSAVATTGEFSSRIELLQGDTLSLAMAQTPVGESWATLPDEGVFVNIVPNRLSASAGHLLAVVNAAQAVYVKDVTGTWSNQLSGFDLPAFANVSAAAFDPGEQKLVIVRATDVWKKDITNDIWTEITGDLAGITDIRAVIAYGSYTWIIDWTNGTIHEGYGDTWRRIDGLGTTPLVSPNGLFMRDGKLHTLETTNGIIMSWDATNSEWIAGETIVGFDPSTIALNYDETTSSLTWVDTTDGTIYNKVDGETATVVEALSGAVFAVKSGGEDYASDASGIKSLEDVYAVELSNINFTLKEILPPVEDSTMAPEDAFVAEEWEDADGYEAFIMSHSENIDYGPDSFIYDAKENLWYSEKGAAKGRFEDQKDWKRVVPEDEIETAVAYLDPESATEAPKVIRGGFTEVEKEVQLLEMIATSVFDASDIYSLRKDLAGEELVTKVGDRVRLMYDQLAINHIEFTDPKTAPIYREDENGRGYLELVAGGEYVIVNTATSDAFHLISAVPGVGVIQSEAVAIDAGIPLRPSKLGRSFFTQAALVSDQKPTTEIESVIEEINILAYRYEQGLLTDLEYFFASSTVEFSFVGDVNLRDIKSIKGMFYGTNVTTDLSKFDVSNVEDFSKAFAFTTNNIDVTSWSTDSAVYMDEMFANNAVFNSPVDHLETKNVVTMSGMFKDCPMFDQDISGLDFSSAEDISYLLAGCLSFNKSVDGIVAPNVSVADGLLMNCTSFNQTVVLTLTNAGSLTHLLAGCTDLSSKDVTINAPQASTIDYMMAGCTSFNGRVQLNSTEIVSANSAFHSCATWDAPLVLDFSKLLTANRMFMNCTNFNQALNISPLIIEEADDMFYGCNGLITQPFTSFKFMRLKTANRMFYECASMNAEVDLFAPFLTNMDEFFRRCISIANDVRIEANNVTSARYLLAGCSAIRQPVTIAMKNVRDLSYALEDNALLNAPVTVTAPRLETVEGFFKGCEVFNDVIDITTDYVHNFDYFLQDASDYNMPLNLDFSSINSATGMFKNASSFNQSIARIPLNDVTNLSEFLFGTSAFTIDLSPLCVESHIAEPEDFATGSGIATDVGLHPRWGEPCDPGQILR